MDGSVDEWTDGRMEGRVDGWWTDVWTDGWVWEADPCYVLNSMPVILLNVLNVTV